MNNKVDKNSPICQKCQMKYARKDNPIGHWRSRHSINIVVPCKLCGKMFKIQCTKSNAELQNSEHSGTKFKNVKIESFKPALKSEPESNSDIKSLKSSNSDLIAKSIAKSEIKSNTSVKLEPTVYSNVVYFSKPTIKSNTKAKSKDVISRKPSLKRSLPKIYDIAGYCKKIKIDPNLSIENVETNQSEQDSNSTACGSLMAKLKALEAHLDEMNKDFEIQTNQSEENLKELQTKVQEESKQFDMMTTKSTNKRLLKELFHMNNVVYM